jgi:Ca2+-binding EF-hand superfamily protein
MGLMQKTKPIDRLRYQARLMFDHFDADQDGLLSATELSAFSFFSKKQLGELDATPTSEAGSSIDCMDYEAFVELIRFQIAAVKERKDWVAGQLPPKDLNRLLFKASITMQEMAVVLATFKLLDWAGTGSIKLEDLRKAQGLEKIVVDEKLEDADADDDGLLSFEDFLVSYSKVRPVWMAMAVLVTWTSAFYLIFSVPFDPTLKVLISAFLVLKPQIITGTVVRLWRIGQAVWGRIIATREAKAQGASWESIA